MLDQESKQVVDTAFLDTGGAVDYAALSRITVDIPARQMYLRDVMFWKLSEQDGITFGSIRNDIAILQEQLGFHFIGCETNNYGRSEIESLRRDYSLKVYGVNTVGKITSDDIINKGESMDKNAIIKFTNSWRQNALDDPTNRLKLGQILLPTEKTPHMIKWMGQLDSFVRKDPEGIGATGQPKYGAEGSGHDDGIMAALGNIFLIKTKIFKIYHGERANGARFHDERVSGDNTGGKPIGRSVGHVDSSSAYQGM